MTKIKALIVDDEELARKNLAYLLKGYCPDVELIGEAEDITNAKKILNDSPVDLVLLDIEIPNGSGFDLLESINGSLNFQVVFVTAYHEYALRAFKYSAVDYILKPINPEELKQAIAKINPGSVTQSKEQLENLMENLHSKGEVMNKNRITFYGRIAIH